MFKGRHTRSNTHNKQKDIQLEDSVLCYECNKPGHIKFECLVLEKMNKRIVGQTWLLLVVDSLIYWF